MDISKEKTMELLVDLLNDKTLRVLVIYSLISSNTDGDNKDRRKKLTILKKLHEVSANVIVNNNEEEQLKQIKKYLEQGINILESELNS